MPRPQPNRLGRLTRRRFLQSGLFFGAGGLAAACRLTRRSPWRLAPFSADVTVPRGHGMMGGAWLSVGIADPLEAHGWVLLGPDAPVVLVSVDWCEIRNDAYFRWQQALAEAVGTSPERVMISTVHQHDAPVADLAAEAILRERSLAGTLCDPTFHEQAVRRVADAARQSLARARPVSHVGMGKARVERVASNRRYRLPDGAIRFDRTSATRNVFAIEAEEGLIDPWLRTLSFWDRETPILAASFYAVHPMSYYGQGEVSADFPGLARRRRQAETPGLTQIYFSGASGNVTAGKFNTGARENRVVLAGRLQDAMKAAWETTERLPLGASEFRVARLDLEPRSSPGFTEADLMSRLNPEHRPFDQCLAAMGLSWRRRVAEGHPLQVPCLDLGRAALVLVPGETYVEFQLAAQAMRPNDFVCVAGYGDGATGYLPTEAHWREGDANLGDWCWVAPGAETRLRAALQTALSPASDRKRADDGRSMKGPRLAA